MLSHKLCVAQSGCTVADSERNQLSLSLYQFQTIGKLSQYAECVHHLSTMLTVGWILLPMHCVPAEHHHCDCHLCLVQCLHSIVSQLQRTDCVLLRWTCACTSEQFYIGHEELIDELCHQELWRLRNKNSLRRSTHVVTPEDSNLKVWSSQKRVHKTAVLLAQKINFWLHDIQ